MWEGKSSPTSDSQSPSRENAIIMPIAKSIRKAIQKSSSLTIAEGFYKADDWTSCGNYAMNRLMSGDFKKGFPYSKTIIIGGESGSAKSLVAATGAKLAQKDGAVVVWLDSEKASKEDWLERLGVDTSEDKFIYADVATIEDVKKIISDLVKETHKTPEEEREKLYVVVDSYSMLLTAKQFDEAKSGDVVGDQGQHAKQLKDLVKATTHLIGRLPICVVGMVHSMASQDKYNPDEILTGGRGLQYAASLIVVFTKLKMKADQVEDNRLQDEYDENKKVVGIRCKCSVYKSRFAKPFEKVEVQIPYPKGLDPYSGLFDLMLSNGEIDNPSVGWYSYKDTEGKEVKFRKKDFRDHADIVMGLLDERTGIDVQIPEKVQLED